MSEGSVSHPGESGGGDGSLPGRIARPGITDPTSERPLREGFLFFEGAGSVWLRAAIARYCTGDVAGTPLDSSAQRI